MAPSPEYEPLRDEAQVDELDDDVSVSHDEARQPASGFSWLEYSIFLLLGIAMLWAWNMFLAAAPYFHHRFRSSEWASTHFQPSILSVSTVTNLGSVIVLAKSQRNASYEGRISLSLVINVAVFTLLAFSVLATNASVGAYFFFLMVMVFGASLATGINQNGVFAYVSRFGREEYVQAIMAGQGVAGVLPCIVQIISVLAVPEKKQGPPGTGEQESPKSAFAYFITASLISAVTLVAFFYLVRQQCRRGPKLVPDDEAEPDLTGHKTVGLWVLFKKLHWMALAIFLCFALTMVFPVFAAEIESVRDPASAPRLFQPAIFIPLAFLIWNLGDLLGRISVLIPSLSLTHYPWALFVIAVSRIVVIPLYFLCNVHGKGAVVNSDAFYLAVQFLFGITNGYLGSSCMMGAGQWVAVEEREAAGGFMTLMLVGGLTAGSLLSFLAASA
ncbi:nucleoside transporter family [Paecilomyces variotii No. 5]|uniref:Nucleoside transporter family n=1 Tax=Byssochlamys spectabilis (strain No. 5 / NBRC 109023) TaxID=1356009 RepID=V5FE28_BYSSN|nr:nucleoside transporter family [Paecilomyces variotii No. 5]